MTIIPRPILSLDSLSHPAHFKDHLPKVLPQPLLLDPKGYLNSKILRIGFRWPWEDSHHTISTQWKAIYRAALHEDDRKIRSCYKVAHSYFLNTFLPLYYPPKTSIEDATPWMRERHIQLQSRHTQKTIINALSKQRWKESEEYFSPEAIEKHLQLTSNRLPHAPWPHKPAHNPLKRVNAWTEADDQQLYDLTRNWLFEPGRPPKEVIQEHLRNHPTTWPWEKKIDWKWLGTQEPLTRYKLTKGFLKQRFTTHIVPYYILGQSKTEHPLRRSWIVQFVEEHGSQWSAASRLFFTTYDYFISAISFKNAYLSVQTNLSYRNEETTSPLNTQKQPPRSDAMDDALLDLSSLPDLLPTADVEKIDEWCAEFPSLFNTSKDRV